MPTTPIERLLFAQGGQCFFCKMTLVRADASVEHLLASANGGSNGDENCVVCCKAINALLGSMSLKEKIQVVLNQRGEFRCPNGAAPANPKAAAKAAPKPKSVDPASAREERLARVIANLKQRGTSRPRTLATLRPSISSLFRPKLPAAELDWLLQQLQSNGTVTVTGKKLGYSL